MVPAPAVAMTGPSSGLSPRLTELASRSLRAAPNAIQAKAVGLVSAGPGALLRQGRRLLVYVRFDHGAMVGLPALRAAGGEIADSSRRYQTVTVAAKPADLREIAAVANVAAVTEAHAPVTQATCPSGEVISEGVQQLDAGEGPGEAREKFPVDGSGVTVGILSDSFDSAKEAADGSGPVETHALEDEESGDLPGPESPCANKEAVGVLDEFKGKEAADEGRGMAQIVHDVAPGAKIKFATAFKPAMFGFAENIGKLAKAGAQVIADDVFYFEEPFFQNGPVAVAVDEAVKSGVAYFSAAGNDNLTDPEGHEIASWETPKFRNAGSCPPEVQSLSGFNAGHCLDFDPGAGVDKTFGIKVEPESALTVDLQWDEPWFGVETDLDAFLLNAGGQLIELEASDNINSQQPTEILQWVNSSSSTQTVQLVLNRFVGTQPRLKLGLLENGSGVAATEYPKSTGEDVVGPTIFGHSGSASAVSVGAMRFSSKAAPEKYSSRGPVRHDFGPVNGGEEPAAPIAPEILSKPDVVATDCGLTTFFASFAKGAGWRFCGTSAAAPHAAGVAALMFDEESTAKPVEIRAALQSGASEVGEFGACAVGAGLIDATAAIEDLLSPPVFAAEECALPEAEGSVEEARASGNWGSETPPPPPSPKTSTPVTPAGGSISPPRTFFRHRPSKVIRARGRTVTVVFAFGSDQAGVTFACRIDGGLFRPCHKRLKRRFGIGPHSLRVVAEANGVGDGSPAIYRFRVKRLR
jgi:subtilisin family serine protease